MKLESMPTASCVEVTYVVLSATPFQVTNELRSKKLDPVTVNVKLDPPTAAEGGERTAMVAGGGS